MRESAEFLEILKGLESEKEKWVITLDRNVIHLSKKDDEHDFYSFRTSPLDVLWEMLLDKGFEVEEG